MDMRPLFMGTAWTSVRLCISVETGCAMSARASDLAVRALPYPAGDIRRAPENINHDRTVPPSRFRLRIHTGRGLTVDIGSPKRREFTTLGDVVNTASRLESSVAKPDQIVISETTRTKLSPSFQ